MSTGVEPWVTPATESAAQLPIVVDDPAGQRFRVHRSAMTSPVCTPRTMKIGRPPTGRRTKSPGSGISDSWPT